MQNDLIMQNQNDDHLNSFVDPFDVENSSNLLRFSNEASLKNAFLQPCDDFERANQEFYLQFCRHDQNQVSIKKRNKARSPSELQAPLIDSSQSSKLSPVQQVNLQHAVPTKPIALAQVPPRSSENVVQLSIEETMSLLSVDLSKFVSRYNEMHEEPFYMNHNMLYDTVVSWTTTNTTTDQVLSSELANLLGEDPLSAELISKIITVYRPQLLKSEKESSNSSYSLQQDQVAQDAQYAHSLAERQQSFESKNSSPAKNVNDLYKIVQQAKNPGSLMLGPKVTVQTEKEKALRKQMRKIEKKCKQELNKKPQQNLDPSLPHNDNEKLTLEDLQKMRENTIKASIKAALEPFQNHQEQLLQVARPVEKFPFVWDLLQSVKTSAAYVSGSKLLLPENFEKKEFLTHDQVKIPLMESSEATQQFLSQFQRLSISQTDPFVQLAFQGFDSLNLIQSTVFETAYHDGNQNMLICAPTGAGKTNIAALTILNVLQSFSVVSNDPATIKKEQFKIVYIAPMKALCAEMASSFEKRLAPFGIKVRELTGDMQMTSKEIMETQMLVVTPEKWDIVTRKSVGDVQLLDLVRLIIIDEVHLLQSDRGHVLETIVARTIRYVERSQKFIRLVGLSATLPSYVDVAQFLHVNPHKGLFVFDERFRPVPLAKTFIGCKAGNKNQLFQDMDYIAFNKAKEILIQENQVMVFVHSRNATVQMANYILEKALYPDPNNGGRTLVDIFKADTARLPGSDKIIARAKYRNLNKLLLNGLGVHHAGMPRAERNIVEKLFKHGVIKVLVCTSTLAWGVNLPAHAVIIRGTEYYDPSHGQMIDIDMLDVMQIFGRAGRPQYDTVGDATIITTHGKLAHYLSMLTNQLPIESRFMKRLTDNLNAEIVLGTVANISEAVEWLRYTYAYIRMFKVSMQLRLPQLQVTP